VTEGILTVRELTECLRQCLEGRFPFVWVRGEVTNLSRPSSGHVYFSLKDQDSQVQCVWFLQQQRRSQGRFDPLTGEVHDKERISPLEALRNGLSAVCAGRISVFSLRGCYQLVVEVLQSEGQGGLAQLFEERKRGLAALGYFALERKRPLPKNAQRVAVITSLTGAAVHDFLELVKNRGSGARIRLVPVLVQGEGAAADIARAVEQTGMRGWAQVIVLIRGGGSLEDLWAFNEECVAQAIFQSQIPVLAGVGHEVDVTLADLTADVRAATPSHAAQLLWPLRDELWQRLDQQTGALARAAAKCLDRVESGLREREIILRRISPVRRYERLGEQMRHACSALDRAAVQWHERKRHALDALCGVLDARNPLSLRMLGYVVARNGQGAILRSVGDVLAGEAIEIFLRDGSLSAVVSAVHPIKMQ